MKIAIGLLDEKPEEKEEPMKFLVSKKINQEMTSALEKTHHFGYPDEKLAKFWNMPVEEVQFYVCGNCEYFCETPEAKKAVQKEIPESDGYCKKYEFACRSEKVCDSWEEGKEYYEDEEE
jgi:hypothetical protein